MVEEGDLDDRLEDKATNEVEHATVYCAVVLFT